MRREGSRSTAAAAALAILALLAAAAPLSATATDSDLKHSYAFKLKGSNGYSILAVADSQRADGRGELVLFVSRKNAGATYLAPARLTATTIEADLGRLGTVSLDVVPSGRQETVSSRCANESRDMNESRDIRLEPQIFRGRFEFHGEEEFTDATSTAPADYTRFFVDLLCADPGGEGVGGHSPGARLSVHRAGRAGFQFQAQANSPTRPTRFSATLHERRGEIRIERSASAVGAPGAFRFDFVFHPLEPPFPAATAVVRPPAPFAGAGFFAHRSGAPASWHGNLTVDFPGRAGFDLGGPGTTAQMVRAVQNPGHPFRFP